MNKYTASISLVDFYTKESRHEQGVHSADEAREITLNSVVSDRLPDTEWNIVVEDWTATTAKVTAEATVVVEARTPSEAEDKVYDILRHGYTAPREYLVEIALAEIVLDDDSPVSRLAEIVYEGLWYAHEDADDPDFDGQTSVFIRYTRDAFARLVQKAEAYERLNGR